MVQATQSLALFFRGRLGIRGGRGGREGEGGGVEGEEGEGAVAIKQTAHHAVTRHLATQGVKSLDDNPGTRGLGTTVTPCSCC